MNGWWGAIGLVVVLAIGVMSAGGTQHFKTERAYVNYCKGEMDRAGLPREQAEPGCKCMYRQGRAAAEKRDAYELTDAEAEMFFEQCMGPIIAAYEANAAWSAESDYSSDSYVDEGWNTDDGSEWGTN